MTLVWLGPGESTPARLPFRRLGAETTRQGDNRSLQVAIPHPPCSLASIPEAFSSPDKFETENKGRNTFLLSSSCERAALRQRDLETTEILLTSLLLVPTSPKALGEREENLEAKGVCPD